MNKIDYTGPYIPPGSKLDALVAEHVLRWPREFRGGLNVYTSDDGREWHAWHEAVAANLPGNTRMLPGFSWSFHASLWADGDGITIREHVNRLEFFDHASGKCVEVYFSEYAWDDIEDHRRLAAQRESAYAHGRCLILLKRLGMEVGRETA